MQGLRLIRYCNGVIVVVAYFDRDVNVDCRCRCPLSVIVAVRVVCSWC